MHQPTYLAQQSSLSEALTVIAAALLMAARELLPWLKRRWARRQVTAIKSGWEGIHQMNNALTDTRRKSAAQRATVVKLTNGGGIPKPGSAVKASIVYESDSDKVPPAFERWQDQPVDAPYAALISKVLQAGVATVYLNTAELEPCSLRSLLEADNTRGVSFHLLGIAPANWAMYACYEFDTDVVDQTGKLLLTPSQTDRLRSGATNLRDIVKTYNEVLL